MSSDEGAAWQARPKAKGESVRLAEASAGFKRQGRARQGEQGSARQSAHGAELDAPVAGLVG
ncbi:MAG: hypothetical protein ACK40O_14275, partial [Allosphingosinicella sp.]